MTPQEQVKAVCPDAVCRYHGNRKTLKYVVWDSHYDISIVLGHGTTEAEAWSNAADNLTDKNQ